MMLLNKNKPQMDKLTEQQGIEYDLMVYEEHDKKLEALDKSKSQFPTEIEERKIEIITASEVLVEME